MKDIDRGSVASHCSSPCDCDMRTALVGDGCEVCNPVLAAEMSGMKRGSCIHRIPYGRTCHVVSFDESGILVSDPGVWRGRISWKTFRTKWKML